MTIDFDKTRDLSKLKITKHIGEINSSKYLNNCEDNLFHLMYMIHVITLCTIICMLDKDVNKIFFRQSVQYNALHGISPWG